MSLPKLPIPSLPNILRPTRSEGVQIDPEVVEGIYARHPVMAEAVRSTLAIGMQAGDFTPETAAQMPTAEHYPESALTNPNESVTYVDFAGRRAVADAERAAREQTARDLAQAARQPDEEDYYAQSA